MPNMFLCVQRCYFPADPLSYMTSERLGIIAFKVPNLAATSQVDDLSIPTSPTPSGMRKTAKHVTFCNPLVDTTKLHSSTPSPTSYSSMRKAAPIKVSFSNTSTIQSAKCKSPPSAPIRSILKPALVHHLCPQAMSPTKSTFKMKSPQVTFPCYTDHIWDIMVLKRAFPNSFNTIGNMSRTYTIRTDPNILPVQHTQ